MTMNRDQLRDSLQAVVSEITDNDGLVLTDDMAPDAVSGWDSVNHIKVLFALEDEFGVSFEVAELVMPDTVGALLDRIQSKL